jgi:hypothetical protein
MRVAARSSASCLRLFPALPSGFQIALAAEYEQQPRIGVLLFDAVAGAARQPIACRLRLDLVEGKRVRQRSACAYCITNRDVVWLGPPPQAAEIPAEWSSMPIAVRPLSPPRSTWPNSISHGVGARTGCSHTSLALPGRRIRGERPSFACSPSNRASLAWRQSGLMKKYQMGAARGAVLRRTARSSARTAVFEPDRLLALSGST